MILYGTQYCFRGGIFHAGDTATSGHYICLAWSREFRAWLLCDDATVTILAHVADGFQAMRDRGFDLYVILLGQAPIAVWTDVCYQAPLFRAMCDHRDLQVSVDDVSLRCEHLQMLEPGAWLDDTWLAMLVRLLRWSCPTVTFMAPEHTYASKTHNHIAGWARGFRVSWEKPIVAAVHVNDNHWVALLLSARLKKVVLYDSLGGRHDATVRRLLTELTRLSDILRPLLELPIEYVHQPRQRNGVDCALYTMMYAECAARTPDTWPPSANFTEPDIAVYRKNLLQRVLLPRVPWTLDSLNWDLSRTYTTGPDVVHRRISWPA